MRQILYTIKTYIKTIYKLLRCNKRIVIPIKKNGTFGLTYFNMSEEEVQKVCYILLDDITFKRIINNEIEEMIK